MMQTSNTPSIVISAGEPAGIGPDIILALTQQDWPCELIVVGDPHVFTNRAQQLKLSVSLNLIDKPSKIPTKKGYLNIIPILLSTPCIPGILDPNHGKAILESIETAALGCLQGNFDAMVTCPVQKSNLQTAGINFNGHTEYLAKLANSQDVVMLFANQWMKVALLTTHISLRDVPNAITPQRLSHTLEILDEQLQKYFAIKHPKIAVCGLNPHAGESGFLGKEEIDIIEPCIKQLTTKGLHVHGPYPADSLFHPARIKNFDVILAMYHDQGLPVIKYQGFGHTANITLGLPFIRTSVDHGTALALAGSSQADATGLITAIQYALNIYQMKGASQYHEG